MLTPFRSQRKAGRGTWSGQGLARQVRNLGEHPARLRDTALCPQLSNPTKTRDRWRGPRDTPGDYRRGPLTCIPSLPVAWQSLKKGHNCQSVERSWVNGAAYARASGIQRRHSGLLAGGEIGEEEQASRCPVEAGASLGCMLQGATQSVGQLDACIALSPPTAAPLLLTGATGRRHANMGSW